MSDEPKIQTEKLTSIKLDDKNANKGTQRGLRALSDSIGEFGFVEAGTLDKNNRVIGGNKRTEVVADINLSDDALIIDVDGTKPVYLRTPYDLDTPKGRKLAHVLNRVHELSYELDIEQLLQDIESGVDLDGLWNDAELEDLLGDLLKDKQPVDVDPQIDKAEELQDKWQVQSGDVWQLTDTHKVICGDCREPATYDKLLNGEKVNGVFTSPPYAEQRKKQYGGVPTDKYIEWWEAVQENVRAVLADDGSFFVNIKEHCEDGQRVLYCKRLVIEMVERWGWRWVDELCWTHQGYIGKWNNRFKNQFEPIYHYSFSVDIKMNHENVIQDFSDNAPPESLTIYDGIDNRPANTGSPFRQGGKRSKIFNGALPGNVINVPNISTPTCVYQSAAFPVKLPTFFIKAYSDPGDLWLDPFAGSGTTGIAANNEGRRAVLIEKLEKYVAVILERYETTTGTEPKRL